MENKGVENGTEFNREQDFDSALLTLKLSLNDPNHVKGVWCYRRKNMQDAGEETGGFVCEPAISGVCAIANVVDRKPSIILEWLDAQGYLSETEGISLPGFLGALSHFGGMGQLSNARRPDCRLNGSTDESGEIGESLKAHLCAGHPAILCLDPGFWAKDIHFVTAVGYREAEDALLLFDPEAEERDGWYPREAVIAQTRMCILSLTPEESKYAPRYIFKQVFGTAIAGHEQYWPRINHRELARINPDYLGWIHLDRSPINYPIVKERLDKSYYLSANFSGEKSAHGCVTLPFKFGGVFSGQNILLSAHDMKDGSMFAAMILYDEPLWAQVHPVIEFRFPEAAFRAIVFSAYPYNIKPLREEECHTPRFFARKTRFSSPEELKTWADQRVDLSSHPFDRVPQSGDTFVTFCTCNGAFGYDSYVVHAILERVPLS